MTGSTKQSLKHTINVHVPGNRQIALEKLRQTGVPSSKLNSDYAKFPSQILISLGQSNHSNLRGVVPNLHQGKRDQDLSHSSVDYLAIENEHL